MEKKIIFMDGYDSVRDHETQSEVVFSTLIPQDLIEAIGRNKIPDEVVEKVVEMNNSNDMFAIDNYLLDEGLITQDEREIIMESLFQFHFTENNQ
jgi:hypothetical protein